MASYGGETPVSVVSEAVIPNTWSYTVPAGKYLKGFYYKNEISPSTSYLRFDGASVNDLQNLQSPFYLEIFAPAGTLITVSAAVNSTQRQGLLTG